MFLQGINIYILKNTNQCQIVIFLYLIPQNNHVLVGLWDTAGQEDYDRLRPLSYSNAHVFIACFNLTNQDSLTHIEEKWVPELRHYGRKVPIILVGCKKDLRKNKGSKEEVSTSEGMR